MTTELNQPARQAVSGAIETGPETDPVAVPLIAAETTRATAAEAALQTQIDDLDPSRPIGSFDPATFDETTLPAGERNDYLWATASGTITLDGTDYDVSQNDRLRVDVDGTAAGTPANWSFIDRAGLGPNNPLLEFFNTEFQPSNTVDVLNYVDQYGVGVKLQDINTNNSFMTGNDFDVPDNTFRLKFEVRKETSGNIVFVDLRRVSDNLLNRLSVNPNDGVTGFTNGSATVVDNGHSYTVDAIFNIPTTGDHRIVLSPDFGAGEECNVFYSFDKFFAEAEPVNVNRERWEVTARNANGQGGGDDIFPFESDKLEQTHHSRLVTYNNDATWTIETGLHPVQVILNAHTTGTTGTAFRASYIKETGAAAGTRLPNSTDGVFGETVADVVATAIIPANTTITVEGRSVSSGNNQALEVGASMEFIELVGPDRTVYGLESTFNITAATLNDYDWNWSTSQNFLLTTADQATVNVEAPAGVRQGDQVSTVFESTNATGTVFTFDAALVDLEGNELPPLILSAGESRRIVFGSIGSTVKALDYPAEALNADDLVRFKNTRAPLFAAMGHEGAGGIAVVGTFIPGGDESLAIPMTYNPDSLGFNTTVSTTTAGQITFGGGVNGNWNRYAESCDALFNFGDRMRFVVPDTGSFDTQSFAFTTELPGSSPANQIYGHVHLEFTNANHHIRDVNYRRVYTGASSAGTFDVERTLTGLAFYRNDVEFYSIELFPKPVEKTLVMRQDLTVPADGLFADDDEAYYFSAPTPKSAVKFSDLRNIENFRRGDGTFRFEMRYSDHTAGTAADPIIDVWEQTSNPLTVGEEVVQGFNLISTNSPYGVFRGLARSSSASTMFDGTAGTDWWRSMGLNTAFSGGFATQEDATSVVSTIGELYIIPDDDAVETPVICNPLHGESGPIDINGTTNVPLSWTPNALGEYTIEVTGVNPGAANDTGHIRIGTTGVGSTEVFNGTAAADRFGDGPLTRQYTFTVTSLVEHTITFGTGGGSAFENVTVETVDCPDELIELPQFVFDVAERAATVPTVFPFIFADVDLDVAMADMPVGVARHFQTGAAVNFTSTSDIGAAVNGLISSTPALPTTATVAVPSGVQGFVTKNDNGSHTIWYTT